MINERLQELQQELNNQSIKINLLPGSETHIEPGILDLLEKGALQTLNNTRNIYVELPFSQALPLYTEQLLFEMNI